MKARLPSGIDLEGTPDEMKDFLSGDIDIQRHKSIVKAPINTLMQLPKQEVTMTIKKSAHGNSAPLRWTQEYINKTAYILANYVRIHKGEVFSFSTLVSKALGPATQICGKYKENIVDLLRRSHGINIANDGFKKHIKISTNHEKATEHRKVMHLSEKEMKRRSDRMKFIQSRAKSLQKEFNLPRGRALAQASQEWNAKNRPIYMVHTPSEFDMDKTEGLLKHAVINGRVTQNDFNTVFGQHSMNHFEKWLMYIIVNAVKFETKLNIKGKFMKENYDLIYKGESQSSQEAKKGLEETQ